MFNNNEIPTSEEIYLSVKVGKLPKKVKKVKYCVTTLHNEIKICGCGECTYFQKFYKKFRKSLIGIYKRMYI
jgi:hypothetical protein